MTSVERDRWAEWLAERRFGGDPEIREPIDRFGSDERRASAFGYPADGLEEIKAKLSAVFGETETQPPDRNPMLDFDERDLLRIAEGAGFFPIRLRLDAWIERQEPRSWDGFLDTAWNPNVPTLREAMEQALSARERGRMSAVLRPLVERGGGEWRMAFAHLRATRA